VIPVTVHVVHGHGGLKSQRREDGQLVRGVVPFHVRRGIRLGVPHLLGLSQDLFERPSLVRHLGQHVVGSPVDDPHDRLDLVGDQGFLDGLDDGDAAGDGRLEIEPYPVFPGQLDQLAAVLGDDVLVGRHHVLAPLQRPRDVAPGRLDPAAGAADELDDDVDRRIVQDLPGVGGDPFQSHGDAAGLRRIPHQDPADLDGAAGAVGKLLRVLCHDFDDAGTDGAEAHQPDADR